MAEYKTVRLGDVCKIPITDGTHQTPTYSTKEEGIPFLSSKDVTTQTIDWDNIKYITKDLHEVLYKRITPQKDDILLAKNGTTGVAAIVEDNRVFDIYVTLALLRPNQEIIYPKYLLQVINSPSCKRQFNSHLKGVGVPNLHLKEINETKILLPPLKIQKQIAAQLDKCTSIINKNKQILEKYDTLIKSRFIEMFGDPVQNPMGWEVKKLGNMCSAIMNGTTPKGGEQVYVENGITFLRSQNVWRNKIDLEDVAYIDETTHKSMKKSSLKKYDILMTKTGRINTENSSLGRAALFLGEDDSANINGHVYLIRLEKEYNHEFVIRILTSPEYRDYIRSVCVGGIDKRQVNKDHIEDFPIIQPPKDRQEEYSNFVQQIDKSKFAVQKSLEKAETLYKSLMQEYFG